MKQSEILAEVQSTIGNNPYVTPADINGWTDRAVLEMAKYVEPYEDHGSFITTAGLREYNLPDNLIRLKEPVMYRGNKLTKISLEEAMTLYSNYWVIISPPSPLQGVPDRFYFRRTSSVSITTPGSGAQKFLDGAAAGKNIIGFYFTPNDAQQVDFFGMFIPGKLSGPNDSPSFEEQWHHMIVDYDLKLAYRKLNKLDLEELSAREWDKQLLQFKHSNYVDPEYVQTGIPDMVEQ